MKRLLESDASSFEGALLRAVAVERPSPDLELRMRAALGLDPAPPALPEPGVEPAARAASAAASHPLSLIGLVAAGLIAGASITHREPSVLPARETAERRAEPSVVVAPAEPSREPANAPAHDALAPVPLEALPRAAAPASNAKAPSNDLGEEMRLIDSARAHVSSGAAKKALSVLAAYDRRFPRGALRQEAAVMRVEALEKSGNDKRAAELAKKFVSEHPNSPHVERVQKLAR
jgi:TolA-binding protein